jgi:hypothetical protein
VRVAGRVETAAMHLETVLLEPDDDRLCLTWRGAVPVDKAALQVESVRVGLLSLLAAGVKVP